MVQECIAKGPLGIATSHQPKENKRTTVGNSSYMLASQDLVLILLSPPLRHVSASRGTSERVTHQKPSATRAADQSAMPFLRRAAAATASRFFQSRQLYCDMHGLPSRQEQLAESSPSAPRVILPIPWDAPPAPPHWIPPSSSSTSSGSSLTSKTYDFPSSSPFQPAAPSVRGKSSTPVASVHDGKRIIRQCQGTSEESA